ncbi:MAG: amidohydrolase family protein [Acidobacteria bacterium]|nr:amidohydrolase family protein [Acidobacteriota bacterium]
MLGLSRRDFLACSGIALRRVEPELVLYNANILTMDSRNPSAEAVAISDGRFLFVGSHSDVRNAARAAARQVDLGGRTVVPGFIDAHTHPSYSGLRHLRWVDSDLRSIAAIQKALAERAARTKPGEWVLAFKYDDTKTSDGRRLRKQDLDAAAPNHPVYVEHRGGHTAYVNSLALQKAGLTDASPDPAGGQLERVDGHLTGCLRERATEPFWKLMPTNYTRAERQEAVRLIAKMMTSTGVTSVHDAEGTPDDLRAYQEAFEPVPRLLFHPVSRPAQVDRGRRANRPG